MPGGHAVFAVATFTYPLNFVLIQYDLVLTAQQTDTKLLFILLLLCNSDAVT